MIIQQSIMKQSRQKSVLNQTISIQKNKYPKCGKVKSHAKEQLTFICLSPNCTSRGLICSLCKNSTLHQGHNVKPFNAFLEKLDSMLKDNELNKGMILEQSTLSNRNNELGMVDELQEAHLESLSMLKLQIQAISSKIQACQQEIMKEYETSRQKILIQYQKQKLLNKTVFQIQSYLSADREGETNILDLQLYVSKLLNLIKINGKSDYQVHNDAETILNGYIFKNNCLKENLLLWQRETNNILGQLFKLKLDYHVNKQMKTTRPTTALEANKQINKHFHLTFSPLFKTDSIMLSNQNRVAKVKDDKHGKVILLSIKALDIKKFPIKYKVATLANTSNIQIGLCLKSAAHQKAYKFDKSTPQHGYFTVSSNGFIYCSGDQAVNNTKGGFTFKGGDELSLQLQKKQRCVIRKKGQAKAVEISLKGLSEGDWKQLYLCVCLGNKDDKIQLVP